MMTRYKTFAALASIALLAACQNRQVQLPTRANFTAAVNDYLAQRGQLCLAKFDWPIDVTDAESAAPSPATLQLQALEKLGLATSHVERLVATRGTAAQAPNGPVHRYTLTTEGLKYYRHVPVVIRTATQQVTHPADFCVAKLSLDRVFGWETPRDANGRSVSSVLFSYQIDPAPWASTTEARRAFPLVVRAIANARTLQLRLGVHLTREGWVADELSE